MALFETLITGIKRLETSFGNPAAENGPLGQKAEPLMEEGILVERETLPDCRRTGR